LSGAITGQQVRLREDVEFKAWKNNPVVKLIYIGERGRVKAAAGRKVNKGGIPRCIPRRRPVGGLSTWVSL